MAYERLTESEQRLVRSIEERREALLEDLRLHVETPTGSGHTPGLDETRERFVGRLEALGASTTTIPGDPRPVWLGGPDAMRQATAASPPEPPPCVVCERLNGRTAAQAGRVLITGHLDTVHDPASDFRHLTIAGDGKTATGPGCVDMKGGLVIAMAALEALEACGVPVAWSVLLNSDEETGTFHSAKAIEDVSREHDWGIALEPALPAGELAIERGGSGQFMLEVQGRSAHVGRAFKEGVSAVSGLAEALVQIAGMSDADRGRIVSVAPLEGGVATNAVPDLARAWGNVRFPDEQVAAELEAMLNALQREANLDAGQAGVTLHSTFNRPAKPLQPGTERLANLAREAAEDLGQKLPFAKTGGVCDGNIMQGVGLPTIDTMGVRGGGLHTPDEWIELDSLVERCALLAVVIGRLSAQT